jgi:hypothetical protein
METSSWWGQKEGMTNRVVTVDVKLSDCLLGSEPITVLIRPSIIPWLLEAGKA